ncbi:MAG: zinc ribbon domain-containing protein [Oscillospiraceae bacterium]
MLWLSRKDIEHISRRLLRDYLRKVPQKIDHIDPADFAEKMCSLQFTFADISEAHDAIGLTATSGVIITIPQKDGTRLDYELDGKTAFIDQSLVAENQIGRLNFTMMHEAAHQLFWILYPEEYEAQTPRCVFRMTDEHTQYPVLDWEEWQTNVLTSFLLLPKELVYALSERLVCGECGTLYRRCTWTRNGEKRVVWRCVSRLDYGKKYCHNSPTLDEAPLQQAILAALNTAMADKNSLIRQITDAMETEIIPFPGGTMSLGDIERRLRELEQQFQTLLEKATDDPAAYGGQFKEILDEQTLLKERRSGILADNNEQAKDNQRILDAAQTLENASPHITEWDESAVRQLVETVKVLSKDEVAVTLKGGIEICQKIMY